MFYQKERRCKMKIYNETIELGLKTFFKNIEKFKPLTKEEEVKLALRISKGDKEALDTIVLSNLRFAIKVAMKYVNQGLDLSDLISCTIIGLYNAAKNFEPNRNQKFISYAVWWIRQAILMELGNNSRTIRIPLHHIAILHDINKINAKQGAHDIYDIAEEMDMPESKVRELLNIAARCSSLDSTIKVKSGDDVTLGDCITDDSYDNTESEIDRVFLKREVSRVIDTLPKREADCIRCYFGIEQDYPLTLQEIGFKYNVSRERVRQIITATKKKLKRKFQMLEGALK